jgi:hypothetical protein
MLPLQSQSMTRFVSTINLVPRTSLNRNIAQIIALMQAGPQGQGTRAPGAIMDADAEVYLGVVVERREIDNPWEDYTWRPLAVMPNAPLEVNWQDLQQGEGWKHFLARTLPLDLYKSETDGYRENLGQPVPLVFVVLRPGEEAEEEEVEPFILTACPHEASGYVESGEVIVEGVRMPPEVAEWLADFVEQHHVEEPFRKRKNKRHQDRDQGSRPRGRFGGAAS